MVIPILVIGALLWGFAELTDDVLERDTHAFDRAVLLALREPGRPEHPIGPSWMHEVARDVTALGGYTIVTMLAICVTGFLWIRRKHRTALVLVAGVAGAAMVSHLLKSFFGRPRPDLVPHLTEVYTSSFPSGHSTVAAGAYLTIGMLLARVQPGARLRAYVLAMSAVVVLLIGVSRVYLGVHWPTDVVAGWVLGAAWALAVWTLARAIEARRSRRGPSEHEATA